MTNEDGPIMVFTEDGKWLVDYGSYANGYHSTRSEAIDAAKAAATREKRELVIEADTIGSVADADSQP